MLTGFDWLRRSRTGAELLATLKYLEVKPDLFPGAEKEIGPPHSALDGPCQRCWVYPRQSFRTLYCEACQAILARANKLGGISRQAIVLWGFVDQLPRQLQTGEGFGNIRVFSTYVHDKNHFLLVMGRRELKPWTQELVLYHGSNLKGLIQVFPTTGAGRQASMGDILCRAVHHEARFTMDQLRVRFYSAPYQVLVPHVRDREKVLTFEVGIRVERIQDASIRRLPFQQKIGAGLTPTQFQAKVDAGTVRHVGLTESVSMIADAMGWKLDSITDVIQPKIASTRVSSQFLTVEKGQVCGIVQDGVGHRKGDPLVTLHMEAYLGSPETYDAVHVEGVPAIHSKVSGGFHGDIATAWSAMNSVPKVLSATRGLHTMRSLPIPSWYGVR